MKLLSATIRNYRVHRETTVHLDTPLAMIHGPNESGKSTLAEAIHRALFLRANTGGRIREQMLPAHGGTPSVEVTFQAKGKTYTLRKVFSGPNGSASLQPEGEQALSGDEAETALSEILGVAGALSGQGAAKALPNRWGHLWVWQGKSSDSPFETLAEAQAPLQQRLQALGGPNLLSSETDNRVIQKLQQWREATYTSTGRPKTGSAIQQAEAERDKARERRGNAQNNMNRLHQAAETYQQALRDEQRFTESLTTTRAQLDEINKKLRQAGELKSRHQENTRLRAEAEQKRQDLVNADQEIREMEGRIKTLHEEVTPYAQKLGTLEEEAKAAKLDWEQASQERDNLSRKLAQQRRQADALQSHLNFLREGQRIADLEKRLAKIQERQKAADNLRQRFSPLEAFTKQKLTQLRKAVTATEKAQAKLDAYALQVELLESDQEVQLDGQALSPGKALTLTRTGTLSIGKKTHLRLIPGGTTDIAEAHDEAEKAKQKRDDLLQELGVQNPESAENKLRERESVQADLQKLESELAESPLETIQTDLQNARGSQAKHLDRRNELTDPNQTETFPEDLDSAEQDADNCRQALAQVEGQHNRANASETAARQKEERTRQAFETAKNAHDSQTKEINDLQSKLHYAIEQKGNTEERSRKINTAQAAFDQAHTAERETQQQLDDLGVDQLALDQKRLTEASARDDENLRQATTRITEARTTLRSSGYSDPERELKEAEAACTAAEERLESLQHQAKVRQSLLDRLLAAQREITQALTQPLEDAVTPYLQNIFPGSRPRFVWSSDQASPRLENFELDRTSRQKGHYPFNDLSHGTREQTALALRLALAGLLAKDHDDCLPLVLDDAFTHADRDRIEKLKTLLYQGSQNNLQIILLTCHPENYSGLGATEIPLTAVAAAGLSDTANPSPSTPSEPSLTALGELTTETFLQALRDMGGKAGNVKLQNQLSCTDGAYEEVKNELLQKGLIQTGRGRGGSVALAEQ